MKQAKLLSLVLFAAMLGCTGGANMPPPENVTPIDPMVGAKATLTAVAKDGQISSGLEEVQAAFENLKATDAAKGEKLINELGELQKASSPDEIKAKAKAIVDQL
jgi:hypothetical protein